MRSIKFFQRSILTFFALFAILSTTSCASGTKPFGVIFTRADSENGLDTYMDIYKITDNTQGQIEQLTFTPTIGEYYFFASPDGTTLVFRTEWYSAFDEPESELALEIPRSVYMLDTVTKKLTNITDLLADDKYHVVMKDFSMDWSLDQKQFMVIENKETDDKFESFLKFMDVDGKNRKEISIPNAGEPLSFVQSAKWSPDGKKILLMQGFGILTKARMTNPGDALLVYDIESKDIKKLTNYTDACTQAKWSPNSQQIVMSCSFEPVIPDGPDGRGPDTIRIFDIAKPDQAYEHIGFSPCYDPSWSPNGKQIVFVCDKGPQPQGPFDKTPPKKGLFVVNANGTEFREVDLGDLGNLPGRIFDPTWTPDGTQIVYVAGAENYQTQIYSINLDGSNQVMLTKEEASYRVISVYPVP